MEEQLARQKDELSRDTPTTVGFVEGILEVIQEGVRLDHEQYV